MLVLVDVLAVVGVVVGIVGDVVVGCKLLVFLLFLGFPFL